VKARKLSFRERQEWEGMEAAILTAEERVAACEAEVSRAANASHAALTEACHALEEAQRVVEQLYARWQELEALTQ
jgi:ATP-binding cassette subfamily F protein uup